MCMAWVFKLKDMQITRNMLMWFKEVKICSILMQRWTWVFFGDNVWHNSTHCKDIHDWKWWLPNSLCHYVRVGQYICNGHSLTGYCLLVGLKMDFKGGTSHLLMNANLCTFNAFLFPSHQQWMFMSKRHRKYNICCCCTWTILMVCGSWSNTPKAFVDFGFLHILENCKKINIGQQISQKHVHQRSL